MHSFLLTTRFGEFTSYAPLIRFVFWRRDNQPLDKRGHLQKAGLFTVQSPVVEG
jgi:hypothetical protein